MDSAVSQPWVLLSGSFRSSGLQGDRHSTTMSFASHVKPRVTNTHLQRDITPVDGYPENVFVCLVLSA